MTGDPSELAVGRHKPVRLLGGTTETANSVATAGLGPSAPRHITRTF